MGNAPTQHNGNSTIVGPALDDNLSSLKRIRRSKFRLFVVCWCGGRIRADTKKGRAQLHSPFDPGRQQHLVSLSLIDCVISPGNRLRCSPS